jgi:hypothetical protein
VQLDRDGKPLAETSFQSTETDARKIAEQVVKVVVELLPKQ